MTLAAPVDVAVTVPPVPAYATAAEHLHAELARLDLELARQVLRRRLAGRYAGDPRYRGLYVPDELAEALVRPPPMDAGDADRLAGHDERIRAERARIAARVAASPDGVLRLPALAARFGLDRLDVDALLLAIAPELEPRYATLISWLQDDATLRRPTVALVADLWADPTAARTSLGPGAPLVRGRLLALAEPAGGGVRVPRPDQVLVPASRVVDHLLGDDRPEDTLRDCLRRYAAGQAPVPLARLATVDSTITALHSTARLIDGGYGVAVLCGAAGSGRRTAALALAGALGRPFVVLDPAAAPPQVATEELLDLAIREARLAGATLVIPDADGLVCDGDAHLVTTALSRTGAGAVVLTGARPWYRGLDAAADWLEVEVAEPGFAQRRALWRVALGPPPPTPWWRPSRTRSGWARPRSLRPPGPRSGRPAARSTTVDWRPPPARSPLTRWAASPGRSGPRTPGRI